MAPPAGPDRARQLKVAGAVADGYSCAAAELPKPGFPAFSQRGHAQDQGACGTIVACRVDVEIDGVRVHAGDIVFGDRDGVPVMPRAAAEEASRRAREKAIPQRKLRDAIREPARARSTASTPSA